MTRRTDFKKANSYTGQKLKGEFDIAYKIDGVRLLWRDGRIVTRNNKVPPGLDRALTIEAKEAVRIDEDCEAYAGSFFGTSAPLNRLEPEIGCITSDMIYPLIDMDPRLLIEKVVNPTDEYIQEQLKAALRKGYEGLVLRGNNRWYRVKPYFTADVRVTGWFEQQDKDGNPKGQLGGFDTDYGKVTAFTEADRVLLWDNPQQYVGRMIEVIYRELYATGKFRYCVKFVHFRDDKDDESFDTKNYEVM